jgi:hypothetical protein
LTSKNTKRIDLLASNNDATRTVGIQIKTCQGEMKAWILGQENEHFRSEHLFYVFVSLCGCDVPEYHIVPGSVVADRLYNGHKNWLDTPGKHGQIHKDNSVRKFSDLKDEYLDKWELLQLD